MKKYAKVIGANEELAFIIGLLHDIGRFYQITYYDTFDDNKSINHALMGIKKLDECNLYKYFDILPIYKNIVRDAILNHNCYAVLEEPITEEGEMQTKLLRDCDKISILDQYVKVRIHEIKDHIYENDKINSTILNTMAERKLNKYEDIKNDLDEICYYISYVFDVNFEETYQEVLSYVNIILDWYRTDARFDIVKEYIDDFKLERKKNYARYKI